jgi:outer membrane protein assembly factor BamA
VETLTLALSDKGTPSPASSRPEAPRRRRTIDIAFLVEQGPRVHVERIDIVGNKKTKDFVIRREFRIAEGDPVNSFLIERGRKRVRALGFFKSVEVTHKTGLRARTRWSSPSRWSRTSPTTCRSASATRWPEGVVGDISLTERNFLGNGQWLRLNLAGSLTRLQADVGFTEPRFLGTNLAAGFDLFYKDVDYTTQASYKSQKIGGTCAWAIRSTSSGRRASTTRSAQQDLRRRPRRLARHQGGGPGFRTRPPTPTTPPPSATRSLRHARQQEAADLGVYYTVAQDLAGARRRRALSSARSARRAATTPSATT